VFLGETAQRGEDGVANDCPDDNSLDGAVTIRALEDGRDVAGRDRGRSVGVAVYEGEQVVLFEIVQGGDRLDQQRSRRARRLDVPTARFEQGVNVARRGRVSRFVSHR
jgi:hypothetical protein